MVVEVHNVHVVRVECRRYLYTAANRLCSERSGNMPIALREKFPGFGR